MTRRIMVVILFFNLSWAEVKFTDVTESLGIPKKISAGGRSAWGDFNNDGFLDLFCVGDPNVLFLNQEGTKFKDVTDSAGVSNTAGHSASWGDFDNDGLLDLFQAGWGRKSLLYHNLGQGKFSEVGAKLGVQGPAEENPSEAPAWADYDQDGFLDLYVAAYDRSQFGGQPDMLYHNTKEKFVNVTGDKIPKDQSCGRSVAWADYNNDGLIDVYVGNYRLQPNFLYKNNGDGTFTDVASQAGVDGSEHTLGVAWGDYDNDGNLDLFTATVHRGSILYRNKGNGKFEDVTGQAGVRGAWNGTGALWGDYDNDGDLDLVTADVYNAEIIYLYQNDGNGKFKNVAKEAGLSYGGWCQSFVDFDNDGFLDLQVGAGPDKRGLTIYHNEGNTNHWIEIKLIGKDCNSMAIGARVKITAGGKEQIREVSGGRGMCQGMARVHFGLGKATKVDLLEVRWPCGRIEKEENIPSDQIITRAEGWTQKENGEPSEGKNGGTDTPKPDGINGDRTGEFPSTPPTHKGCKCSFENSPYFNLLALLAFILISRKRKVFGYK